MRCQLFQAEVASRLGNRAGTQRSLDDATRWILHSGSVEHLCLYHLVRARVAMRERDGAGAQSAVADGLHLARRCGLGLYHIELLSVSAELSLNESQPAAAEQLAREAFRMATAPECGCFTIGSGREGEVGWLTAHWRARPAGGGDGDFGSGAGIEHRAGSMISGLNEAFQGLKASGYPGTPI